MKVSPTTKGTFRWFFTFCLALFLFSVNSLQAQTYVSSNVAKQRLTTKANQLDNQLAQGTISQIDYTVKIKFVIYVLENGIGNHNFASNAENNDKVAGIYASALQTAETNFLGTHPQYAIELNTIKEEVDTLLQQ
jgi:hypothetical protein